MTAPVHVALEDSLRDLTAWARASDIAIHTLEVSIGGRTVAHGELAPFGVAVPHRMYSVSKSLNALAVLLLVDDGLVGLDDRIVDHFGDLLLEGPVHPWRVETTIDHMLAMTGPFSRTTYVEAEDHWLDTYFTVEPTHRPGTMFTYDTSASYVLSALVERVSGQSVFDVLRSRVFEPLGVELGEDARFLTGPEGVCHGGSGLVVAPHALLRLAEVINAHGRLGDRQVLPPDVADRLIEHRSRPSMQTWGAALRAGYGRQTWLPEAGTWMMFGLGGQLVIGIPSRELAAVITADTTSLTGGDQRFVEAVLHALRGVEGDSSASAPSSAVASVALEAPGPQHLASNARPVAGIFDLVSGEDAPAHVTLELDASGGSIAFTGHALRFATGDATVARVSLGSGAPFGSGVSNAVAAKRAGWPEPGVLEVHVSAHDDDIATVRLRIVVIDDTVTVLSQGFGQTTSPGWSWRGSFRARP